MSRDDGRSMAVKKQERFLPRAELRAGWLCNVCSTKEQGNNSSERHSPTPTGNHVEHRAKLRGLSSRVLGFNMTTARWGGPASWGASSAPTAGTCRRCGCLAPARPPRAALCGGLALTTTTLQLSRVTGSPPRLPVPCIPPRHAHRRKAEPSESPSRGR